MTTTPTPEQCSHEAWEARSGGRKCSDCGDWLDDTARTAPPGAEQVARPPEVEALVKALRTAVDAATVFQDGGDIHALQAFETWLPDARAALAQMGEG